MSDSPNHTGGLEACATRLSGIVEDLFAGLRVIASAAERAWLPLAAEGRTLTRRDVIALKPLVSEFLGSHRFADGAGLIVTPGAVSDAEWCLEWWQSTSNGKLRPLDLDIDPASSGFYDYTSFSWFRRPRDSGRRTVSGPYVDYRGADQYILTFTTPVLLGERFLGVAGADVTVAGFEAEVWACLREMSEGVALVNAERRVIVSTVPEYGAGTRVKDMPAGSLATPLALPDLAWELLRLS